jgi:hypothetical protein
METLSMESDRRVSGATAEVIQKGGLGRTWRRFLRTSPRVSKSTDFKEAATLLGALN